MDIVYKKSDKIFNQHPYWTKQPINAIEYFIEKYSNVGDLVLDPFCGTGMTGVASLLKNRRVVLSDLSPICIHISKGYNTVIDFEEIDVVKYLNLIKNRISKIYNTKCEDCGKDANILFTVLGEKYKSIETGLYFSNEEYFEAVKDDKDIVIPTQGKKTFEGFETIRIVYKCTCSKIKKYKIPSNEDIISQNIMSWDEKNIPKDAFFGKEPKRNFKKGVFNVSQLYSNRNLSALSILKSEIDKIKDNKIKNYFLFCFTSILFNCSLMSRYRKYENTSIKMGTFYIPPLIKDNNVFSSFKNKLKKNINYNKETYSNLLNPDFKVIKSSATELSKIENDSIDYIYTDPPYADVLSYSELNIVWESWLNEVTKNEKEMIISENEGKSIDHYYSLFSKFLNQASLKLKKGKFMTLIFHHPKIEYWHHLQKILLSSNFVPIKNDRPIRLISKNKTSSQHQTKKVSQCFLAFTFENRKSKEFSVKPFNKKIIDKIYEKAESNNYITDADKYDYLINSLFSDFEIPINLKF